MAETISDMVRDAFHKGYLSGLRDARDECATGYGHIRLRRDGIHSVVSIFHDGKEIDIIREIYDNNFDHWVTPCGMLAEINIAKGNPRG